MPTTSNFERREKFSTFISTMASSSGETPFSNPIIPTSMPSGSIVTGCGLSLVENLSNAQQKDGLPPSLNSNSSNLRHTSNKWAEIHVYNANHKDIESTIACAAEFLPNAYDSRGEGFIDYTQLPTPLVYNPPSTEPIEEVIRKPMYTNRIEVLRYSGNAEHPSDFDQEAQTHFQRLQDVLNFYDRVFGRLALDVRMVLLTPT